METVNAGIINTGIINTGIINTGIINTEIKEAYRNNPQGNPTHNPPRAHPDNNTQVPRVNLTTQDPSPTARGRTSSARRSVHGQQFRTSGYGPTAPQSAPPVTQYGSEITSTIELGPGATLNQGDRVIGVTRSGVVQRGSRIGGYITADNNSEIHQGDTVDDSRAGRPIHHGVTTRDRA
ncbi:hypothetical protein EKO27_g10711 [Xylaria grammica]|uniref:Uncharacterized protein n=1 Tax=Xylaria grammica TaxID=363999 RepID=A0A439CQH5_9PEZI|nr:hypothetical protein EKO27_g10711 [Xylaria grammica]